MLCSQVWFIVPVAAIMVCVSLFLLIMPAIQSPILPLVSVATMLTAVPVYVLFVMEKPWKLRPEFVERLSGKSKIIIQSFRWKEAGVLVAAMVMKLYLTMVSESHTDTVMEILIPFRCHREHCFPKNIVNLFIYVEMFKDHRKFNLEFIIRYLNVSASIL